MAAAARISDSTAHAGAFTGPGASTVLVNGIAALRLGDPFACALPPLAGPHPPNAVASASGSVHIGGQPAARVGDRTGCGAVIVSGSPNVLIGD